MSVPQRPPRGQTSQIETTETDDAITIRIPRAATVAETDALVPLAECGLDDRTWRALVRTGRLRAVRIGRRLYTRRSYLLALVDELPAVGSPPATDADDEDADLRAAARGAGLRRIGGVR